MSRQPYSQGQWNSHDDGNYLEDDSAAYDYQELPEYSHHPTHLQTSTYYETSAVSSPLHQADSNPYGSTQYPSYSSYSTYTSPAGSMQNTYDPLEYAEYYQPPYKEPLSPAYPAPSTYDAAQTYAPQPISDYVIPSQYAPLQSVKGESANDYTSAVPTPSSPTSRSHSHTTSRKVASKHADAAETSRSSSSNMRASKTSRGPPKALLGVFDANIEPQARRKHRKQFTEEGKKKVEAVRSVGACGQCRRSKRTCETTRPCQSCLRRTSTVEEATALCAAPVETGSLSEHKYSDSRERRKHSYS